MSQGPAQWHYAEGGQQRGPFSADQMAAMARAGTIAGATPVWTAGMAGWLPFSQSPLASAASAPGMPPPVMMGAGASGVDPDSFGGAVRTCFNKYAAFSGRARRPEFWYFALFNILAGSVASVVDMILFGAGSGVSPLNGIYGLAVLVPSIAVGARRLHDIDRSGWWQLIGLVPIVGLIVLIVFYCRRGTQGHNRFG